MCRRTALACAAAAMLLGALALLGWATGLSVLAGGDVTVAKIDPSENAYVPMAPYVFCGSGYMFHPGGVYGPVGVVDAIRTQRAAARSRRFRAGPTRPICRARRPRRGTTSRAK